jgi:hypothetical protein
MLTECKEPELPNYEKLPTTCRKKQRVIFGDTFGRLTPGWAGSGLSPWLRDDDDDDDDDDDGTFAACYIVGAGKKGLMNTSYM